MRLRDYLYLAAEHRGLVVLCAFGGVLLAAVAVGPFDLAIVLPAIVIAGMVVLALMAFVGRRGRHGARVVRRGEEQPKEHDRHDVPQRDQA